MFTLEGLQGDPLCKFPASYTQSVAIFTNQLRLISKNKKTKDVTKDGSLVIHTSDRKRPHIGVCLQTSSHKLQNQLRDDSAAS